MSRAKIKLKPRGGFTVLECVCALVIIALLALTVLLAFSSASGEMAVSSEVRRQSTEYANKAETALSDGSGTSEELNLSFTIGGYAMSYNSNELTKGRLFKFEHSGSPEVSIYAYKPDKDPQTP